MSGDEAFTEREFEDALRTFQALWEAKGDLERQLGDERRRTEKLRNQISEQVVAQDRLREGLRAAQRTGEKQERRAERDRETILTLEQQLADAQKKQHQRESSCQRCIELEAQVLALERDNGKLKRAAAELESLRAYGKELQDLESASQVPSLAPGAPERSPAATIDRDDRYDSGFAPLVRVEDSQRDHASVGSRLSAAPAASARSRLKLSKKHRSDQFESLGSEQQGEYPEPEVPVTARKKRCVSPTFDETEQQSSQSSQPSQPSQPILDTPALLGDDDEDDVPTSRWSSRGAADAVDTAGGTGMHPKHGQATGRGMLAADGSQLAETAAQQDSMAVLLDEVAKPTRSKSRESGKENALPIHRPSAVFNVSTPRSSAVNHGCDEVRAAAAPGPGARAVASAAAVPGEARDAVPETGNGKASPVPNVSTSQTQLTQHSPDLFPEEGCADASGSQHDSTVTTAAGSSKFKVKLRARTPFTQSQRS